MKSPFARLFHRSIAGAMLLFVAALLLPSLLHAEEQLYTCGMHPQIIKKEPGDCPICGMKLTPVRANGKSGKTGAAAPSGERKIKYYKSTMIPGVISDKPGKDAHGMDMVPVYEDEDMSAASTIKIDAATIQRMNLKTDAVTRGPVRRSLRAVGVVEFNERGLRDITTKYEGWLEKLYVNATWTSVKAGDPLFEIYSPDLYNAQLNYLVAVRAEGSGTGPLTRSALDRLKLFDVSADFVTELAKSGEVRRTYLYRAPADGVVIEKMGVEGQMMKPGERIYRLADLSTVWVNAQIYERDLAVVTPGQHAEVRSTYGDERVFHGAVDQLLPQVEGMTRTATARLIIDNPDGFLRPGMFADVRFSADLAADAVLVPDSAVLRSGERNTVFVALDDGSFEPREVKLGARTDNYRYAVLSGLSAGERVVTSGQFMLDSESQLREAIQKMLRGDTAQATPAAAPTEHASHQADDGNSGANEASDHAPVVSLAFAAVDAAAALAADDLAGYTRTLPAVRTALAAYFEADPHAAHGPLAKFKNAPPDRKDIGAARGDFAPFSTAVTDLARSQHLHHTEGLHLFECAMAPVVGTGRWLQREGGVKNPFLGSEMSTCGTEIDAHGASAQAPASPAGQETMMAPVLPPGHPPLDKATLVSFVRSQSAMGRADATATAGDGKCGSCGMSQAAMAAGEPCEHDEK